MKIVQTVDDYILLKGAAKKNKNETKEQKGGLLSTLLGTLRVNLFGNQLSGREIVRACSANKKGKWIARAASGNEKEKETVTAAHGNEMDFWCYLIL